MANQTTDNGGPRQLLMPATSPSPSPSTDPLGPDSQGHPSAPTGGSDRETGKSRSHLLLSLLSERLDGVIQSDFQEYRHLLPVLCRHGDASLSDFLLQPPQAQFVPPSLLEKSESNNHFSQDGDARVGGSSSQSTDSELERLAVQLWNHIENRVQDGRGGEKVGQEIPSIDLDSSPVARTRRRLQALGVGLSADLFDQQISVTRGPTWARTTKETIQGDESDDAVIPSSYRELDTGSYLDAPYAHLLREERLHALGGANVAYSGTSRGDRETSQKRSLEQIRSQALALVPRPKLGELPSPSNGQTKPLTSSSKLISPISRLSRPPPIIPRPSGSKRMRMDDGQGRLLLSSLAPPMPPPPPLQRPLLPSRYRLLPNREGALRPLAPPHAIRIVPPPPPPPPPPPVPSATAKGRPIEAQHPATSSTDLPMPPFSASEGSRARPSLGTAPIETEAIPWQRAEISTSLPDLDLLIDRVCGHRATERAGSVSGDEPEQPTDQVAHGVGGLPSGSTLEIVGPPASGKTFLCISIAVKERLDALLRKNLDSSNDPLNRIRDGECRRNLSNLDRLRALSFDCHWERSCTDVEQVLIFDTEGSLSPERVVSFAESAIDSLLADQRFQRPSGFDQDGLFRAVLSGIHISRITSPHELIAALSCCLPPPNNEDAMSCRRGAYEDDLDCYKEANNGPDDYEYAKAFLPGRTSIIIIDTLSYLFRAPSTSARERSLRNASLEKIRSMVRKLREPRRQPKAGSGAQSRRNPSPPPLSSCTFPPTLIFTNQMAVRIVSEGSGTNGGLSMKDSGAWMVPQLQSRCQAESEHDGRPSPFPRRSHSIPFGTPSGQEDSAGADGRGQAGVTCSIMGMETWRIILFRAGGLGHRFAQLFSPGCSSIDDVPAPRKDPSSQRWIPFDVS